MHYDVIIAEEELLGLLRPAITAATPQISNCGVKRSPGSSAHQSSRNSGVIHSGIYYRPAAFRAVNCKRGYDLMLEFCREHEIQHDVCGKIIVASEEKG
ncbi:MAG: FAD-dependent oxidoreductase [Lewinellaceae bacterium]|nr:FAD-dependent oxidoreductase [Lewinellaceae bacterium]